MSKLITIPGSASPTKFIEWIRVTYKAASWIFNYYEWERKDVESISWILIGWGFQFDTTKWKPSKKKSASYVSNEFGFEIMNANAPIKMRELIRENWEFKSVSAWTKPYKEWKESGMRLTKILYMMDVNDVNKIYKIQFAWLSFWAINKQLKDDLPNYVVTLKAQTETVSTENWDFYMPEIIIDWDSPDALHDALVEKVTFVYDILNGTSWDDAYEIIPNDTESEDVWISAEEVFWNDIP